MWLNSLGGTVEWWYYFFNLFFSNWRNIWLCMQLHNNGNEYYAV